MPSRSEPEILADLIRLLTRLEGESMVRVSDDEKSVRAKKQTADDAELIEQARAALHRHVVAEGKAYLSRPRAPINLWAGVCFSVGAIAAGVSLIFGFNLPLTLAAGMLLVTGASIIIDRKHI